MNGYQDIKRQLFPLLKGLPIVVIVFLASLFFARQVIRYSPNMYQTMAKIKLDDQKYGFSSNNLYDDFDVFSTGNTIEAEAEILKSSLIVEKATQGLGLDVVIYRKGSLKNTMLYDDSPVSIEYKFDEENLFDQLFKLVILDENSFQITYQVDGSSISENGTFNANLKLKGGALTIKKNIELLLIHELQLIGEYEFKVFSSNALIHDLISRLDVVATDKEVAVLRVVYKDEHPRKAAQFTNALCKAYSNDYVSTKSNAANQTSLFIDQKLDVVGLKLTEAEHDLEQFKRTNKVVNTRQETETGLREISKLNIQLMNLEMNEKAVMELQKHIESGEYFEETAINFGFGDLLMTELVKKMKLWQDERHDLLLKYTPDHGKVKSVNAKIDEVRRYIKEALKQNLKEVQIKRAKIEKSTSKAKNMFNELPSREKRQLVLERNFRLQEDVFNFLSQKKIEASIAASALLSFHRVIQPAIAPKEPVSPNKTLITFVSGLLGLILGIVLIYMPRYVQARVTCRDDLERNSMLPVAGIIRVKNTNQDFEMLIKSLLLKQIIKPQNIISIASTLSEEGKSYVAYYLAKTMTQLGYSICLLDTNLENPQEYANAQNWKDVLSKDSSAQLTVAKIDQDFKFNSSDLEDLQSKFDFTIIDCAATAIDVSGVEAMKCADLTLYLVRANHTCINYLAQPDLLAEEFKLENVHLVLNDAEKATSYSGSYVGSRFRYRTKSIGLISGMKHYYQTYVAR
ncbi:MAG: hypothetical protein ACJATS_002261 [Psychroserpens sp.]|jgi:uncharacterized protein involved in exopolysaccharide biosynthesis